MDINELENKVMDLEFKQLKRRIEDQTLDFIVSGYLPDPRARKQSKPAASRTTLNVGNFVPWRSSHNYRTNVHRYEVRNPDGSWRTLSSDRDTWPASVRRDVEKIEAFDRRMSGRILAPLTAATEPTLIR